MRLFLFFVCLSFLRPLFAATPIEELTALFEKSWEFRMAEFPVEASYLGDPRYAGQWDKLAPQDFVRRSDQAQTFLKELSDIDREKLPPADQLNFDLFDKYLSLEMESNSFGLQFLAISQRGGLQTDDELADALSFTSIADYEAWLTRLKAFPAHALQVTELLREGIKRKILFPKILMQRIPPQLEKQLVAKPADSPFFKPFRKFPDSISAAEQTRLTAAAEDAIKQYVLPAFTTFQKFFNEDYLPACPAKTGMSALPGGVEMYAFLVRLNTTTELTPQQIHQIGLDEVARIRTEMEKVKTGTGYTGKLADFFQYLRTEPRFFCKTPLELLNRYRAQAKLADPLMVQLFKTLPRTPYGVEPIPDLIAPDTTTAYYRQPAGDASRAGTFFVNLYKPETRPTWEMVPLAMHESVPGHHIQIALAMEQTAQPKFRRYGGGYTAFVEGWGLYAESLGSEIGLYNDPYDRFGQLTFEMWRAVRLVVDTGMHAMNWDRQKAIDYFKENAPRSELDITNEVDRYLSMPGQALAYKIGQLKILQLREEARLALGDKFDLRDYHDFLMSMGAVPLTIMERDVKAWIAGKAKTDHISTIPR